MKKVVLASFLACAAIASGLPIASAQDAATPSAAAPAPGSAAACAAPAQMPAAEYAVYNNAMTQTTPQAKAAGLEQYLTQFPQSSVKATVLEALMSLYSTFDGAKTQDAADRLLQVDPTNIKALYAETVIRSGAAASLDPTAKPAAMDTVASYAQKGLNAPKPNCMSDADFATLKTAQYPTFYSAIGYDLLLKKGLSAGAIDASTRKSWRWYRRTRRRRPARFCRTSTIWVRHIAGRIPRLPELRILLRPVRLLMRRTTTRRFCRRRRSIATRSITVAMTWI